MAVASPDSIFVEKKKLKNPPLEIHKLGDKVLRQPAKRVTKVDAELRQLIRDMLQTMYSADGIGLAAPQVGINKQLIVIDLDPEDPEAEPLVLINPKIERVAGEVCNYEEGCLSVPGVYMDVKRPEVVEVSFKDETGRPQRIEADGLMARCIQHEMDHLTGVLFVDRVENQLELGEQLKKQGFARQSVRPVA